MRKLGKFMVAMAVTAVATGSVTGAVFARGAHHTRVASTDYAACYDNGVCNGNGTCDVSGICQNGGVCVRESNPCTFESEHHRNVSRTVNTGGSVSNSNTAGTGIADTGSSTVNTDSSVPVTTYAGCYQDGACVNNGSCDAQGICEGGGSCTWTAPADGNYNYENHNYGNHNYGRHNNGRNHGSGRHH